MKKIFYGVLAFLVVALSACEKLVEVKSPLTSFDGTKVYDKDGNAIAVMTGIYQEMSSDGFLQGNSGISMYGGLSADEFTDYQFSSQKNAAYQNRLLPSDVPMWDRMYYRIYTCNSVIDGVEKSTTLSPQVKTQLSGEAKFVRALLYFYLVNFWGELPLNTTTDYQVNSKASRSAVDKVYELITSDLESASSLLSTEFLSADLRTTISERIRPTKWAAKALLARVYLYTGNYAKAEQLATELISTSNRFVLTGLDNVFLGDSQEAIWQIQAISPTWNTFEAKAFVITSSPNYEQPVSLSPQLMAAFEAGDKRRQQWVGELTAGGNTYYFPFKYKVITQFAPHTEAFMVLRLGEQYLIRAEARAQLGKTAEGAGDINALRQRARAAISPGVPNPLPALSASISKADLLTAIAHERQVELFSELAHRWFDLKRTGKVNEVMAVVGPLKGGTWRPERALFPLPQGEIDRNENMKQNPSY